MRILGLKNTITEIKNSTDRLDSRLDIAKERINHLEDKSVENISSETKRGKKNGKYMKEQGKHWRHKEMF